MKKLFTICILMLFGIANAATICFDDGPKAPCTTTTQNEFETLIGMINYGNSTGSPYKISVDKKKKVITIHFTNGKAIANTMAQMEAQGIVRSARPVVISKLYR